MVAEGVAGSADPAAVGAHVPGVADVARLNVLVEVGVVFGLVVALGALPDAQAFDHLGPDLGVEICKQGIGTAANNRYLIAAPLRIKTLASALLEDSI